MTGFVANADNALHISAAVIKQPISRIMAMRTRSAEYIPAPNLRS
jgi:hypothetical protein